jgi:hypothetical protein
MDEKKDTPPPIIGQVTEYVETRIKLLKLQAIEGSSTIAASMIADVAVIISMILAFIFASFTLAFYLGQLFGANWIGFGCVAILYLILAIAVKVNKQRLEKLIANEFIQKILRNL